MEFQDLVQLAEGNTSIAKKKSEKLGRAINSGNVGVNPSAVAAFLAKKKKEQQQQIAAEKEARLKRIAARVNSNLGKKENNERKDKKISGEKHSRDSKKIKVFKNDDTAKISEKHAKKKKKERHEKYVKKSHEVKERSESNREKLEREHRKEKERTELNRKKIKQKSKPPGEKGLSFLDLAKLAKCNSENPGSGKKREKEPLKRPAPKQEEVAFDPDRHVKIKKKKIPPQPPSSREKVDKDYSSGKKEIKANIHSGDIYRDKKGSRDHSKDNKKLSYIYKQQKQQQQKLEQQKHSMVSKKDTKHHNEKPVQRGLVVETVSSSKNFNENRMQKQRMDKMSGVKLKKMQENKGTVAGAGSSIASQNKSISKHMMKSGSGGKLKRSARDVEDEFEKEERELAKKRKLFEMRRITGNKNLTEDDILDDDYDLDEEDEEDESFIDDTGDAADVSKYIRSIFKYDRRRYDDSEEDDLADMESSYAQIEKEEARSARIAKIEDEYEKMKEEEEEEKQKMRMKVKDKKKNAVTESN